jgi:hypothetical protein
MPEERIWQPWCVIITNSVVGMTKDIRLVNRKVGLPKTPVQPLEPAYFRESFE